MFRVTFELQEKTYEITARTVDLGFHPFLAIIEDFEFENKMTLIVSANGDEARKRFGDAKRLLVPMQSIKMLEEIADGEAKISTLKIAKAE